VIVVNCPYSHKIYRGKSSTPARHLVRAVRGAALGHLPGIGWLWRARMLGNENPLFYYFTPNGSGFWLFRNNEPSRVLDGSGSVLDLNLNILWIQIQGDSKKENEGGREAKAFCTGFA
jgi:hypothetical protein